MTTTPKVSRERAEELREFIFQCSRESEWIQNGYWADLLSILSDYAARQDKEDKAAYNYGVSVKDASRIGETPGHPTPSPGSADDERAFKLIGDAASYLMPKLQNKIQEGLYILRSRLSSPPKRVTREWVNKWAIEMALEGSDRTYDDIIHSMLRDLGRVVDDQENGRAG